MDIEVVYENDGEGIWYKHRHVLNGATLVQGMRAHNAQIDFSILRYQIVDFRQLDRLEMSTDQLKEVAAIDREIADLKRSDYRLAILLSSDCMYAIVKMWENYAEEAACTAKVFYDIDEARAWIGNGAVNIQNARVFRM